MRVPLCAVLIALLLAFAVSAKADIVTISFDGLNIGEDVLEFYNSGFGSEGTGPGPAFGVSFSPGWIAGPPDIYGTADGKSAGLSGVAIINVPAGWSGLTSFYYSGGDLAISFYDQENGLGNLVGAWNLLGQEELGDFPAGDMLPLFRSAVFNSSNGNRIDALTNGAQVIPEPTSLLLLGSGLGMIGLAAWRRRK